MLKRLTSDRLARDRLRRKPAPRAQAALESGAVLYFPQPGLSSAPGSEMEFLDAGLTDGKAKNISLDHTSGKLQGTSAHGEDARRAWRR